ncbi:tetratricopeptide repeat protein [bacterium]|nr:tetratricopeptide repeat protein [bacterium]MBU3930215.1 tetratricopeptide repeat protein [bacterium]
MKNKLIFFLFFLFSCATLRGLRAPEAKPDWFVKTPSENGYLFFTGVKTGALSPEAGKREAVNDAFRHIAEYFSVSIKSEYTERKSTASCDFMSLLSAKSRAQIDKAYVDKTHITERCDPNLKKNIYDTFVLIKYPLDEIEKERKRIKLENEENVKRAKYYFERGRYHSDSVALVEGFQNFAIALKILEGTIGEDVLTNEIAGYAVKCLKRIKLNGYPCDPTGSAGTGLLNPLKIKVVYKVGDKEIAIAGMPLNFAFLEGGGILERQGLTNDSGLAECAVAGISNTGQENLVIAVLALNRVLNTANELVQTEAQKMQGLRHIFAFHSTGEPGDIKKQPMMVKISDFANLTGDVDLAWLEQALTDGIVNKLTRISNLHVVERGEDVLLEGSFQKNSGRVKINVRVIKSIDGSVVSVVVEEGEMDKIFEIEENVAIQIARLLKIKVAPDEMRSVKSRDTNNTEAYEAYNRALLEHKKGNHSQAVKMYKKALARDNKFADAYNNLGVCYYNINLLDDAISSYQKAKMIEPLNDAVTVNLATAYFKKGARVKALNLLEDYDSLGSPSVRVLLMTGVIYNRIAEYQKASEALERAIEIQPSAPAYNELGIVYDNRGQYDRAIIMYTGAVKLNPSFYQAFNNMAIAYMAKGEYEQALNPVNKSLALNYECGDTFNLMGLIFANQASYSKAIAAYKRAIHLSGSPQAYYNLSCIYALQNETDLALRFLDHAIDSGFNDINSVSAEPAFKNLISDKRFSELIEKIR